MLMKKILSFLKRLSIFKSYKKWKFKKNNEKILRNKLKNKEPKNKFPLSGNIN